MSSAVHTPYPRRRRSGRAGRAAGGATAALAGRIQRGAAQSGRGPARPDRVVQAPALRPEERALRRSQPDAQQMHLGEASDDDAAGTERRAQAEQDVPAHKRRVAPAATSPTTHQRAVLRRDPRAGRSIEVPNPEAAGSGAGSVRGRRPEGQPPAGAAPGRLRGAEVRAPGHQAPRHRRPCTARRHRRA